jgi:hypothetical protein
MIEPAAIAAVPRAEEAWEPVLLGGLIPFLGALAVFGLIYKAVKDNPEDDRDDDEHSDDGNDQPPT